MTGSWRPVNDRHAIEAVGFIVFFSSEFPPLLQQKLADELKAVLTPMGMSTVRPLKGVAIEDDVPVARVFGTQFLSLGNLSEADAQAGNFSELVSLETNSIGFRTTEYEGWNKARSRFFDVFSTILPLINAVMLPARVRLEFTDRFVWEGDAQPNADDLLRTDSDYIAPHVFRSAKHWHVNTGAFLNSEQPGYDRLIQANIQQAGMTNTLSGETASGIIIMTAREDRIGPENVELAAATYNSLEDILNDMHGDLISAIKQIVADDMAVQIGLGEI